MTHSDNRDNDTSRKAPTNLSRRRFLGNSAAAVVGAAAFGPFVHIGTAQAAQEAGRVPDYYPSDYKDIIEGSKAEGGSLTIYSNMAVYNWKPIIAQFQKHYPWVTDIKTNNLDSSAVFQRYYNEQATGVPAADFVVSGSPQNWINFVERGFALDYKSPEASHIPDWAMPRSGLYTFSTDPILMTYNKYMLDEKLRPTGVGHLAELVESKPDIFQDKVTTYNIEVPFNFGFAINWNYVENTDHAWRKLETILPAVQPEPSSGPMMQKIRSGAYAAGYFMSSTVVLPEVAKTGGKIVGWDYIDDGTPMFLRGMAVSNNARRKNTAKLMLDFLLSRDGQAAIYEGGFTPYRPGLEGVPRTYQSIVNKLGEDNVLRVDYGNVKPSAANKFVDRWQGAL